MNCKRCHAPLQAPARGPYCGTCADDLSHLYEAVYGREGLAFCGCGSPEDAYELVRDILRLAPFYEGWKDGTPNRAKVRELLGRTDAVFYLVLYQLDRAGLIEHGGGIGASWLTQKGVHVLALMESAEESDLDEAGFPHDGQGCTPQCRHWQACRSSYQREREAKQYAPAAIPNGDRECGCYPLAQGQPPPPGMTVVTTTSHDGSLVTAFALSGLCPYHGRTAGDLFWAGKRAFAGQQVTAQPLRD